MEDCFNKRASNPRKPVIIVKAGATAAGARAASSHTGSLAGSDSAYGAAFRQGGVLRAATVEDLFDLALGFAMQPLPGGDRLLILTNAGGPGILAADTAERLGIPLPGVSAALRERILPALPTTASLAGLSFTNTTFGRDLLNPRFDDHRYAFTFMRIRPPELGLIGEKFYFKMRDGDTKRELYEIHSATPKKNLAILQKHCHLLRSIVKSTAVKSRGEKQALFKSENTLSPVHSNPVARLSHTLC